MKRILVVFVALLCSGIGAAEGDMADVLARLKALEEKNKDLEMKLKQAEARPGVTAAIDKAIAASEQKLGKVITSPDPKDRPLTVGGYLDVSYEFNFNHPDNQRNNLRTFDTDANSFNVHYAELNFSRLPTEAGQAGFRFDMAMGTDQRYFAAQDATALPSMRSTQFKDIELEQAYIEYIAGVGNGITLDFGKMVTMHGAEVIRAYDDINSSRSFLFGLAIPFTHTGVRASYDVFKGDEKNNSSGKWTIQGNVMNGWDNIQDQNSAKTFCLTSIWQANKWINWQVNAMYGDETFSDERARFAAATGPDTLTSAAGPFAGVYNDPTTPGIDSTVTGINWGNNGSGGRTLVDTVLTLTPWEKWTFVLNGDYAYESDVTNYSALPVLPKSRRWYGAAGYAKYQFAKKWYVANRSEVFNDPQGVRTGRPQTLLETTLTFDWAISDPFHMRFEYRHDKSNVDAFSDDKGFGLDPTHPFNSDHQDTIMLQWLYKF
ncbi:MAG: outer membrane beta-barrel protein [Planctomycetota bacterium]